ncbi:hypothetical protein GCM10010446_52790 [Streptomyces enissocaesilis]|uniref:Uncharacterized protein n=1 Tax=Streptomyces enissocaesilis TaxID=332589 RepID=A0ABP6K1F9_9ACTN
MSCAARSSESESYGRLYRVGVEAEVEVDGRTNPEPRTASAAPTAPRTPSPRDGPHHLFANRDSDGQNTP